MKSNMKKKAAQNNGDYSLAHVLYQKLGNDWYAFTEVDGDCFMTKVHEDVAIAHKLRNEEHSAEEKNSRKRRAA